jgi:hypothetical protein
MSLLYPVTALGARVRSGRASAFTFSRQGITKIEEFLTTKAPKAHKERKNKALY